MKTVFLVNPRVTMGKPAARMLDKAGHGGSIVIGSTNVFIDGMPAARKGDALACIIHGAGVITQGSASVLVNGMPAARLTDITGCLTLGMSAISVPVALGPPPVSPPPDGAAPLKGVLNGSPQFQGKSHDDTDNKGAGAMAIHAEGQVTDTDKDGTYDTMEGTTEAVRMRNAAYGNLGFIEGGVNHGLDVFYANGKASSRAGYGYRAGGQAETGMLKWGAGGSVAPADSSGRNAYGALAGEANFLHAKAEGDVLIGNDGNRSGLIAKGEAGAETVQGEGTATVTTPSVFGLNAQAKGKLGVSAGSASAGGGAWLYYDHSEGRLYAGVSAGLAALIGIKGDVGISVGKEYKEAPPPAPVPPPTALPSLVDPPDIDFINIPGFGAKGIPGAVLSGSFSVLIGD